MAENPILVENRHFGQEFKFSSRLEILDKKRNLGKDLHFRQESNKNRCFGQKFKFFVESCSTAFLPLREQTFLYGIIFKVDQNYPRTGSFGHLFSPRLLRNMFFAKSCFIFRIIRFCRHFIKK